MPLDFTLVRRVVALVVAALLACAALLGRLAWLDLYHGERLHRISLEQRMKRIPVVAPRGTLYDRAGRVLAGSVTADSAYAVPAEVRRPQATARQLAPLLGRSVAWLERRLRARSSLVWLARRLSPEVAGAVRRLHLSGVGLAPESRRVYPYGPLAGELLGFVGVDNRGLAGIELSENRYLEGHNGYVAVEYDAAGRRIPRARTQYRPPVPGDSLVLTLDVGLQRMAQQEADHLAASTQAERVLVALMDVHTGGILALATVPTFDPARYDRFPASRWRNPLVSDTYPPGSTFKPITAAAALAEGVVTPSSGFFDPGFAVVSGRRIRCWKAGGHGSLDFRHVVMHSCNVGFVETGLRLGVKRFYTYLKRFGFLDRTGVALPGEARALVPPAQGVKPVDLAVMAFGQTLTVTPLQLLDAINSLADGGRLLRPQVVREVVAPDGRVVRRMGPQVVRQVVPPRVADQVAQMMEGVVAEGSGKQAQVPGYTVAGKTGTSQMVVGGRYAPGAYIASFVGFGPMPHPQVTGLVVVERPLGEHFGGQVAAPAWGRLMAEVFPYLGLRPAQRGGRWLTQGRPGPAAGPPLVPPVAGMTPAQALHRLAAAGWRVRLLGRGRVVGTLPAAGTPWPRGGAVTVFGCALS